MLQTNGLILFVTVELEIAICLVAHSQSLTEEPYHALYELEIVRNGEVPGVFGEAHHFVDELHHLSDVQILIVPRILVCLEVDLGDEDSSEVDGVFEPGLDEKHNSVPPAIHNQITRDRKARENVLFRAIQALSLFESGGDPDSEVENQVNLLLALGLLLHESLEIVGREVNFELV